MSASLQDPALPGLERALNGRMMAPAFEAFFRREDPGRDLRLRACQIETVRHRPGKRCRISYLLSGTDAEGSFERRLTCSLLAEGRSPARYLDGAPDAMPGCAPWRPASWWPEMRMVIYAFPYDRKLPALGRLRDPERTRQEVDGRLEGWGWPWPWRAGAVQIEPFKYRSGRRCLIRYQASLEGPRGERSSLAFFGKTYPDAQSRYVYDALVPIRASLEGSNGGFEIPRPLAHLDAAHTLWQEAWHGEGPRARAARVGWPSFLGTGALGRVAAMLAAIHRVDPPPGLLRPAPDTGSLIGEVRDNLQHIRTFEPELVATLERTALLLEDSQPRSPVPAATLHGTFKLAQILCRDEAVAAIDFDAVASGDPHLDLGEFTASLLHLEARDGVASDLVDAAREGFLDAYAKAVPWPCDRSRVAWYAAAFLLAKLHSLFKKHDQGGLDRLPAALRRLESEALRAAGRGA